MNWLKKHQDEIIGLGISFIVFIAAFAWIIWYEVHSHL